MAGRRINPWKVFTGAWVPNWIMGREEVSDGAKLCYARLCQFSGRKGVAWPTQEQLAEELKRSVRSVQMYLEELRAHMLIEIVIGTQGNPNRYYFLSHEWMGLNEVEEAGLFAKGQGAESCALRAQDAAPSEGGVGAESCALRAQDPAPSPNSKDLKNQLKTHAGGGPGAAQRDQRIKRAKIQAEANLAMLEKHRAEVEAGRARDLARLAALAAEVREELRVEALRKMGEWGARKLTRATPENSDVIRAMMVKLLDQGFGADAGKRRSA